MTFTVTPAHAAGGVVQVDPLRAADGEAITLV